MAITCPAASEITNDTTFALAANGVTNGDSHDHDGGDGATIVKIGATTGTSLAATGLITSSSATAGIGYATGAGGAVTQLTSKATGVTNNKICGTVTTHNAALNAATIVTFTVTCSAMAATDVVIINHHSGGTIGAYLVMPNTAAAGSFKITLRNNTAGNLSEALVLRYAIIKAVVS